MTPAQKNDADELPARTVISVPETPEQIEARADAEQASGHSGVAFNLRGYAAGIREGERREKARIAAVLQHIHRRPSYTAQVAASRGGTGDLVEAIARELADDIAARRL